ncbi:MAG TPA: class I SAM-dependent methyltransferase [Dehalococcoidia bacterium]|nr:class I SAM-dependent methyltransferase [Dehalococcoidia bacterium]
MNNYEVLNAEQLVSEHDPFTAGRYRQFHRFFQPGAIRVLDIGCNTGRGGEVLKALDPKLQVVGLDSVEDRLNRISPEVYTRTVHGVCTDIPCSDGEFDVVVAGEVLEHLYPADVDKTLAEVFRVLKLGGRFLMTTPNPGYLKSLVQRTSIMHDPSHLTQHYPDVLKLRMRMIGFSRVRIRGSGKATHFLGYRFPWLRAYGSFLATGDKW